MGKVEIISGITRGRRAEHALRRELPQNPVYILAAKAALWLCSSQMYSFCAATVRAAAGGGCLCIPGMGKTPVPNPQHSSSALPILSPFSPTSVGFAQDTTSGDDSLYF